MQSHFSFETHPHDCIDRRRLADFSPAQARREASAAAMRDKQRIYRQILQWARQRRDFTADELAAGWGCAANHTAPRICELVKLGELVATGERRPTRAGKNAAVLRAVT